MKKQNEAIAILERLKKGEVLQFWPESYLLIEEVQNEEETWACLEEV